jgi:pyruvate kinase
MRFTKIVATLGPATDDPTTLKHLFQAGVNVARLNFTHGSHEEHAARIAQVRTAAAECDHPVAILQDISGPKIRTGKLKDGQSVALKAGQAFTITIDADLIGDAHQVGTTYRELVQDVQAGDNILLSDGLIELEVTGKTSDEVHCKVLNDAVLREKQGINLPGIAISAPTLSEKDIADLHFGLEHGVDYVAISFVRRAEDIQQAKAIIQDHGQDTPMIAKIERPEALAVLNDILDASDGVMVARGDLGVELPLEQVPIIQKHIIDAANFRAKPVITATQMLESMIHNPTPTRAEVSDVANAIIDGSDAVMLSGETSIGEYPVETVQMMARIAEAAETGDDGRVGYAVDSPAWLLHTVQTVPQAIGTAVSAIAKALPIKAIWVFTQSGRTARQVAHYRPDVPIIALTPYEHIYRRLALVWGVIPIRTAYFNGDTEFWNKVIPTVQEEGYAQSGDTVVITGGHPFSQHGDTNFLKIAQIP